jgi:hypothetical protein
LRRSRERTAAAADTIIVVKRARGEADATLHITGRDVLEQELALRFAPEAGTWELLGDAGEYALGQTRRKILEALHEHGPLAPKQVSEVTDVDYENAKKTMQRMFRDGQLAADNGVYSIPVPSVPESPIGTEGQQGQGDTEPLFGDDLSYLEDLAADVLERVEAAP